MRATTLGLLAALLLASGACGSEAGDGRDAAVATADAAIPTPAVTGSFAELNGFLWIYNVRDRVRFTDVTAELDSLHARGFRVLGFYCPYEADPAKWLGSIALDPYATPAVSGTLDEWRALVAGAHMRGMKVVAYFASTVLDVRSELFTTAETQYASGDRTSREVSAFRWAASATEQLPMPAIGPNDWRWSETAGAFYWSLWGDAGLDVSTPGGLAEVERIERFWLDTGLDGFMWDSANADPALRRALAELPTTHSASEKWLTFESTNFEEADLYAEFGLTSWFNLEDDDTENTYSYVARGGDTADDLEEGLVESVDRARALGRYTHAWSLWEEEELPGYADEDAMRVQEAALLAGAGILYGIPDRAPYDRWPAARREALERVLATVNENAALRPSASRTRVPAGPGDHVYAMRRTARDGSQTALLVYNFEATPATVELDLRDTGIATAQTPIDLYAGESMSAMDGETYSVSLPAYGFRFLAVH